MSQIVPIRPYPAAETRGLLKRRDILDNEQELCRDLGKFLSFDEHSLYFPEKDELPRDRYIPEENKLLLPLRQTDEKGTGSLLLGVLLLNGISGLPFQADLPGKAAALCLEKLCLKKLSAADPATGLFHYASFISGAKTEAALVKMFFSGAPDGTGRASGLSVFIMEFPGFSLTDRNFFRTADLNGVMAELKTFFPPEAFFTCLAPDTLAACVPGATNFMCRNIAAGLFPSQTSERAGFPEGHSKDGGQPAFLERMCMHAGYATYPGDWLPDDHCEDEAIAELLIRKAAYATERLHGFDGAFALGFREILAKGGSVLEKLPYEDLLIDLGEKDGAADGMCFTVWNGAGPCGEAQLYEVRRECSKAQMLMLTSPEHPVNPGDRLRFKGFGSESLKNPLTSALTYRGLHEEIISRQDPQYALALIRMPASGTPDGNVRTSDLYSCLSALLPKNALCASYSTDSVFLYLSDIERNTCQEIFTNLSDKLTAALGCRPFIGVFHYPYLDYRRPDSGECCRKALDYAELLEDPHIGIFDSTALNISADRMYSRGELDAAAEEYRRSIQADEHNDMAINSLGVCLAALGRHAEARQIFERAAAAAPDDPSVQYNLANACLAADDPCSAEKALLRCLELDPKHDYARIRLGMLAQEQGDRERAKTLFTETSKLSPDLALPYRCLAGLADDAQQARRLLQKALRLNGDDPICLEKLAELYLNGGEDPYLAAALLKKSLALDPRSSSARALLTRALDLQEETSRP